MASIVPYRPPVDFCSFQSFGVDYNNQFEPLPCWQRVLIVVFAILGVGIGGLVLSYYWRNRMVEQLYAADHQKYQVTQPHFENPATGSSTQAQPDSFVEKPIRGNTPFGAIEDQAFAAQVEQIKAESGIKEQSCILNGKTFKELLKTRDGRYFIPVKNDFSCPDIPFSRQQLPKGVYCVAPVSTPRYDLLFGAPGFACAEQLEQAFGKDKVFKLILRHQRAEPENGPDPTWLVLCMDKEINEKRIQEFAQFVSSLSSPF